MNQVILFLLTYIFTFLLYQLFIIRRAKRKKNPKEPLEVTYLKMKYHLDLKGESYKQLLQIIAFTSAFDISVVVSVIMLLENFYLEIIISFILIIVMIVVSYHMVYLFYKKKGKIKDGK